MHCLNPDCPDARAGTPGEYRRELSSCPKCGAALVPAAAGEERSTGAPDPDAFVPVGRLADASQLPAIVALLDQAGIPHEVRHAEAANLSVWGAGHAFNPIVGTPEILAEAARAEDARALLASLDEGAAEELDLPEVEPDAEQEDEEPSLSLMAMRQRAQRRAAEGWTGRQLAARPSLARVVGFGLLAAALASVGVLGMVETGELRMGWFGSALLSAIIAFDGWRRYRGGARGGLLPRALGCPACDGPLRLSLAERSARAFTCPGCGEEFQVEDDRASTA